MRRRRFPIWPRRARGQQYRNCGSARVTRFRYCSIPPIWLECQRSGQFLQEQLAAPVEGDIRAALAPLAPDSLAVSLVEGWRGEVCHVALTDAAGRFRRYKIVDPSFHNWTGLALALRGQAISDFPVCNKSFNLSYAGFDL